MDIRESLSELITYSAPDDATVVMLWKKPYAFGLDSLRGVSIQPAHVISKLCGAEYNDMATNPLNRAPVGTGPFKVTAWETYGLPSATACHFFSESARCDPSMQPLPTDPTAADKLLDEVGWKDSDGDGIRDKC